MAVKAPRSASKKAIAAAARAKVGDADKVKPRKVRNSFVIFCSDMKHAPWAKGLLMTDQKREAGVRWRAMSFQDKLPYVQRYELDRANLKEATKALKKQGRLLEVKKPPPPLVPTIQKLTVDQMDDFLPYRKRGNTPAALKRMSSAAATTDADEGEGDGDSVQSKKSSKAKSQSKKASARAATPKQQRKQQPNVFAAAPAPAAPFRQFDKQLEDAVTKRITDKMRKIASPDGVIPMMSEKAWTKMVNESMRHVVSGAGAQEDGEDEDGDAELAEIESGADDDDDDA